MSAIGGIYNFKGKAVDETLLTALGNTLAIRGPDAGHYLLSNTVGMVYRAFNTNLQSCAEIQPVTSIAGQFLTWDGRLDNRDELSSNLFHKLDDSITDVELVMRSYAKWGVDCLAKLIGDFSLALWDSTTRQLIFARDPVGVRPLFYHANKERIVWSTELEPLLDFPGIEVEIDDAYIAGYLTGFPEAWQTPYKGIHAVPPGNLIITHEGSLHVRRFWNLNPNYEIRYKTDQDYEEHFRQLFRESVRARLRVNGTVWAELSGGLDSSSIVCMADEILKEANTQAHQLETVSAVFTEAPSSDERKFIRYVEEKRGVIGHHFSESEFPVLAPSANKNFTAIPNGLQSFAAYQIGVRDAMRASGARVLLSGVGGDEMLTSAPEPFPELGDLLVKCRPFELHRRLKVWSLALKKPYLQLLWRNTLMPVLPRRIRITCAPTGMKRALELVHQDFIKRMDLRDRLLGPNDIFGCRLPSARNQAVAFLSVRKDICTGYHRLWGTVEMSYPFLHRPLVEFLQAIPCAQWLRPGESRTLLRRALINLLPPEIVGRKGKGNPSEALLRAMKRELPTLENLLTDARVCARGYVNADKLKSQLDRAKRTDEVNSLRLLRICHLELWLRAFECRSRQPIILQGGKALQNRVAYQAVNW
jgi:asparagine synthase (glutamine-hydrolysing)